MPDRYLMLVNFYGWYMPYLTMLSVYLYGSWRSLSGQYSFSSRNCSVAHHYYHKSLRYDTILSPSGQFIPSYNQNVYFNIILLHLRLPSFISFSPSTKVARYLSS
jgi:hypothetical protein